MRANPVLPDDLPIDELQSRDRLAAADAGGFQALADEHAVAAAPDLPAAVLPGASDPIPDPLPAQEAVLDPALWPSDDLSEVPLLAFDEEPLLNPIFLPPNGTGPVAGEIAYDSILVEWRHLGADPSLDWDHPFSGDGAGPSASGTLSDTVLDTADLLDIAAHRFGASSLQPGYALASAAPALSGGHITLLDMEFDAKGGKPGSGGGGSGGGDSGVLTNYFAGSADGTSGYDIWIEFKGTWTADLQLAFKNAADYFVTVISDDIGGGGLYRGKIIDDLYITAELKAIDGVGGILGQAGPTAVWTANDLTAAGKMQFDSADATTYFGLGLWDDIVTHEMMHVLGFGSLWNYGSHALVTNFEYTGGYAVAAYNLVEPGATSIPVESDGGSGTAGSHWDEQTLGNELMTGYINNTNYLSQFSVMSLADLGYNVVYSDYPYDNTLIA